MRGNPCQAILLIQLGWSELPPAVLRGGWANTRKLEWSRDLRLGAGSAAAGGGGQRTSLYTIHNTLYTIHNIFKPKMFHSVFLGLIFINLQLKSYF